MRVCIRSGAVGGEMKSGEDDSANVIPMRTNQRVNFIVRFYFLYLILFFCLCFEAYLLVSRYFLFACLIRHDNNFCHVYCHNKLKHFSILPMLAIPCLECICDLIIINFDEQLCCNSFGTKICFNKLCCLSGRND